ncbi:hypothetical protein BDY21DRAFT_329590 [Lineolata rhizophorae]|uniref:Uncharacterized protein n=1 Tax=Lineolata rhizophorae TaxID=578093 RepID=A0A6A6PDE0_9PEZI|nr:hypothetical protein BDY21DRAFT_329590 [Lineolata rhizophorae]
MIPDTADNHRLCRHQGSSVTLRSDVRDRGAYDRIMQDDIHRQGTTSEEAKGLRNARNFVTLNIERQMHPSPGYTYATADWYISEASQSRNPTSTSAAELAHSVEQRTHYDSGTDCSAGQADHSSPTLSPPELVDGSASGLQWQYRPSREVLEEAATTQHKWIEEEIARASGS